MDKIETRDFRPLLSNTEKDKMQDEKRNDYKDLYTYYYYISNYPTHYIST